MKYVEGLYEMWDEMRDAINAQIELPTDNELLDELCAVEYGFSNKQQIQIEKKEDMKKRGLSSPDCADSLSLTFAEKVIKNKPKPEVNQSRYYESVNASVGWMG